MLLISQNLINYDMKFPSDVVLRVNMAWVDNLEDFRQILNKSNSDFFIDFPSGRIKPPNNKYDIKDLIPIFSEYSKIKYLAISNVEHSRQIKEFSTIVRNGIKIVPKIETIKGINNISEICTQLSQNDNIMLDHDDLFTDVVKNGFSTDVFLDNVNNLVSFCKRSDINLLRTKGVIFSDRI